MSVLGTGVAAGVAQTGLQAQQTARKQDRKKAQDAEAARRVRETFEAHLHATEDVDKVELVEATTLEGHVQQDLVEPQGEATDEPVAELETASNAPSTDTDPSDDEGTLYHHLDVTG